MAGMKLPEHIRDLRADGQAGSRVDSGDQGRPRSDLGGAARWGERRKLGLNIAVVGVLGAAIVCVAACARVAHESRDIQGEWTTVSVEGSNGFDVGSKWKFYDKLLDNPGGRVHYSIVPLLHTITWGDSGSSWRSWARATYELNGDSLKIWVDIDDNSKTLYVLKRVPPD